MVLAMYVIGLGLGYILGIEFQKFKQRKALSENKIDKERIDRHRDGYDLTQNRGGLGS